MPPGAVCVPVSVGAGAPPLGAVCVPVSVVVWVSVVVVCVVSVVDAQQVLLPGIFVVLLTWLGARLAVTGDITVGDLVAFYGWAAFLVLPLLALFLHTSPGLGTSRYAPFRFLCRPEATVLELAPAAG